jgi:hypothetical protein
LLMETSTASGHAVQTTIFITFYSREGAILGEKGGVSLNRPAEGLPVLGKGTSSRKT